MSPWIKASASAILCIACVFAQASQPLTAAQCNDYPFQPLKGEVTHAQLMQELAELESVGYNPTGDEIDYPADLERAEHRLQVKYQNDCLSNPAQSKAD
jgi:hypothetical protein